MKGCCMSHRAYIASSMAQRQAYAPALAEGEYKTLVSLPMGHGSGFTTAVTGPLMPKASIVIMDALKPSIADVLCAIKKYRPTIWPTVPLLLNRYVATPDLQKYCDLSSIRLVLSGAAPLSSKTFTWLAKRGIKVAEAYGLSEMVNIVTMSSVKEDALGRVGVPMAHIDVVLADVATGELIEDADVSGEIVVRGPSCMKEYWHDEERTRHQMENGWLYTGDMGVFDERGILRITGRKKNMVIVSGFNVYPQEVADTLCEHPDVREAWVCGVPDEERGEVCAAYIVKNEASCMTAGDLRQWCRMHMTRYKVPRVIKFAECMPVMENGKPDCGAMKQEPDSTCSHARPRVRGEACSPCIALPNASKAQRKSRIRYARIRLMGRLCKPL